MDDDAREDVGKGDPAAEEAASSFRASGGELLGVLQPVGQGAGGVYFGVQGSTELVAADLLSQGLLPDLGGIGSTGLLRPRAGARRRNCSGGVHDHAVGGIQLGSPDHQPERPLLGMEDVVEVPGADQRAPLLAPPAGRRADRHGPEQALPFRHVDGVGAAAMRSAALLAMFGAAMALIGEQDASSWRSQFRTIMFWLGGCAGIFRWILFLSRR